MHQTQHTDWKLSLGSGFALGQKLPAECKQRADASHQFSHTGAGDMWEDMARGSCVLLVTVSVYASMCQGRLSSRAGKCLRCNEQDSISHIRTLCRTHLHGLPKKRKRSFNRCILFDSSICDVQGLTSKSLMSFTSSLKFPCPLSISFVNPISQAASTVKSISN